MRAGKSYSKLSLYEFQHCAPRRDLSIGLSSDANGDHMQKLHPREVGLLIYHFGVNKIAGVSSSRVVLGFFSSIPYG